jgi:adenylate cyclase
MGSEIERKFLVSGTAWKQAGPGERIRQGYLALDPACTVRVRAAGERGSLAIKGPTTGITRLEFEYSIPLADAQRLLDELCHQPLIDKTRYALEVGGHRWEVDEFHGANAGLVVAEIELQHEDEEFERPDWLGEEVSHDPRYYNAGLVRKPFASW